MEAFDKAKEYFEVIKIHLKNDKLTDDLSYYAFLLSLLPIPGIQQVGQTIDRIFSNKSLKSKLDNIWDEINSVNDKISTIEDGIQKLQVIASTFKFNSSLNDELSDIIHSIASETPVEKEWIVETENWSYQSILNSIVEANIAQIIARDNSVNKIENSEIKANKTHLHASNNSQNYVDKTKFYNDLGSVEMNGIATQGNIIIEGSGIGFREGGTLFFGAIPNLVSVKCPFCQTILEFDKRQLSGKSQIQCHSCKSIMSFTTN